MARELIIWGPPGCGKTTALAGRANQAAQHYGGERVLVCSLTNAAALEVAGRETVIPPANIGTLHSFAYRAIGTPEIADSPKGLKRWNEWVGENGLAHLRLTVKGADVDQASAEGQWAGETQGDRSYSTYQVARARQQEVAPGTFAADFASAWERWKAEEGRYDFTDLFSVCLSDVERAPGDPAVLFMDEAQDMSALGLALLRKWGAHAEHLVMVGDPLQNLYSWAGSDATAFCAGEVEEDRKWVLSQSYRVPRAVHVQAVGWIEPLRREFEALFGKPLEYRPRDAEGEVIRRGEFHHRYPETAVREALRYVDQGKTVMFAASCAFMLESLLAVLRHEGIPFHNPWRVKNGAWNPLARRKGTSATDRVLAFLKPSPDTWGEEAGTWSVADLWRWLEVCEAKGICLHGMKSAVEQAAREPFGTGVELGLEQVFEWLEPEAALAGLDAGANLKPGWLRQRLLGTKARVMEYPIRVCEAGGPQALRDRPRLIVGTIHSLKGSEADVVFVFPDLSQSGMDGWFRGGEEKAAIQRAFYVSMTRARETLILCGPASPLAVNLAA